MKTLLSLLAMLIAFNFSYAQTNTFPSSGNVGIGTTNPNAKLDLVEDRTGATALKLTNRNNNQTWGMAVDVDAVDDKKFMIYDVTGSTPWFTINPSGNVGIGTTNPMGKLTVKTTGAGLEFDTDADGGSMLSYDRTNNLFKKLGFRAGKFGFLVNDVEKITIDENGNLGIGTTTPREALSVNGNIRAKEIKVETANWPDYVFKSQYHLSSLAELKTYIEQNQHLPEMPSEQEVAKDGLDLGEMNKLLVKKVEELTLYLIEKDKQLQEQAIFNEMLLKRTNRIEQEPLLK